MYELTYELMYEIMHGINVRIRRSVMFVDGFDSIYIYICYIKI